MTTTTSKSSAVRRPFHRVQPSGPAFSMTVPKLRLPARGAESWLDVTNPSSLPPSLPLYPDILSLPPSFPLILPILLSLPPSRQIKEAARRCSHFRPRSELRMARGGAGEEEEEEAEEQEWGSRAKAACKQRERERPTP